MGQQLRGCVGRTSTLGVEELRGQRLGLQGVAQAEVCVKDQLLCLRRCAGWPKQTLPADVPTLGSQPTHNLYVVVFIQQEVFNL